LKNAWLSFLEISRLDVRVNRLTDTR